MSLALLGFCLSALAVALPARDFPPAVPFPKPVILPAPAVCVLPNGLRVIVVERRGLPLVTLRLVIRSGAEADPPELPGVAELTAELLNQGSTSRSARAIAEAVDSAGGVMETGAEWDDSFVSLSVLSDQANLAFDLVSDMVIHPAFAPSEIERKREETLSALKIAREDPVYVADTAVRQVIFAGSPYGHPEDGTTESVQKITAEDLRSFHNQWYHPAGAILAVVGDLSTAEAFEQAEKAFSAWKGGPSPRAARSHSASRDSREVVVIDKPDAVQTELRVGVVGAPRSSPAYYALDVANQVLGGPGGNRLFELLRSQRGLTYSASSELISHRATGAWVAKSSTRTSETIKSVRMMLEQMRRLRDRPINQEERETAQGYLVGHLALEFESSDNIAERFLELVVHDLPAGDWSRFAERILALRAEDVQNAARTYLDLDHNIIVMVGNAAGFSKDLKKLGAYRIIPLEHLDFASETLEHREGAAGKR